MLPVIWLLISAVNCLNVPDPRRVDEILGKFVVDVTTSIFSPSSVTALLCLNDADGFRLTRQMSRQNVLHDLRKSIDPLLLSSRIHHQHFFVIDLDCPGAIDILVKASKNKMFVAPAQWLILQDLRSVQIFGRTISNLENLIVGENFSSIHETFENFTIFPDSKVIIGRRLNDNFFRILSPYRPSPQRDLILEDRGYWTPDDGLFLRNRNPDSRRRRDLQKTELKCSMVISDPETWNHLEDYENKLLDPITRANYHWVNHLANRMNATVSFISTTSWGYREKNGSWSGMIGMLLRGEADLGGTGAYIIPSRLDVADFLQLYTPAGCKFLFRRPPLSYVSNLFSLPFGRNVWIASGVFLLIVILLLYFAMKWEFKMKTMLSASSTLRMPANIDDEPTISNNLLVIIGAVLQQGSAYEARAVPSRIIVLMLLLATLNLYASYTASIVALLQSSATSIKTPRDLLDSPLKLALFNVSHNRYYFQADGDPLIKELHDKVIKGKKDSDAFMNLEEGIREVRKGLFAFHVEFSQGYTLIQETFEESEKCGIDQIDFQNMFSPLMAVQQNSPYLEILRVGALWIHETGLQDREITRLFTDKPVCQGHNSVVRVGITECYAAIMTMAYGIGFTLIILLLEKIWAKWARSNEPAAVAESEGDG